MPQITLRDAFAERLQNFQLTYEWEAASAALQLVPQAAEIVTVVYGDDAGRKIASEILRIAGVNNEDDAYAWREAVSAIDPTETNSPFLEDLHELTAFARFGIFTVWESLGCKGESFWAKKSIRPAADVPEAVMRVCDRIRILLDLVPDGEKKASELAVLRDMALARLAYDAGDLLTVHQLAALSDVTVKRVQNAVYADKKAPMVDAENRVTREGCDRWLADRDYQPSIWQQVQGLGELKQDWGLDVILETIGENPLYDDFVFVPVADDGSVFRPALKRERVQHFSIGAKGAEETVEDFDEALKKLSRMAVPHWRRPNASGNWGIVSGQSWKRIRRVELEALPR